MYKILRVNILIFSKLEKCRNPVKKEGGMIIIHWRWRLMFILQSCLINWEFGWVNVQNINQTAKVPKLLRDCIGLSIFKSQNKTHLFRSAFIVWLCALRSSCYFNCFSLIDFKIFSLCDVNIEKLNKLNALLLLLLHRLSPISEIHLTYGAYSKGNESVLWQYELKWWCNLVFNYFLLKTAAKYQK